MKMRGIAIMMMVTPGSLATRRTVVRAIAALRVSDIRGLLNGEVVGEFAGDIRGASQVAARDGQECGLERGRGHVDRLERGGRPEPAKRVGEHRGLAGLERLGRGVPAHGPGR